jgi:hypothetical protein
MIELAHRSGRWRVMGATALVALSLLIFPLGAHAAVQATLYVAPDGSDTACTLDKPCSLSQAQLNVRAINSGMTGDIDIDLLGGTYTLAAPLTFTESASTHDSGTNGHNIVYQAYGDSTPVLSGSYQIAGWTPVSGNSDLYQASVPSG